MKKVKLTPTAAVVLAPETETGTSGDTEATVVRERVAKHELLDAQGNPTEDEEVAHGIRYTLLKTGKSFSAMYKPGTDASRMFAIFGMKTLATNEASQARQAGNADQLAAIQDRFDLIEGGKWVDRTGGGKIDLDTLAQAAYNVIKAKDPQKETSVDALRQKLESDASFRSTVRGVKEITNEYATLKGRTVATLEDVFAGIGA